MSQIDWTKPIRLISHPGIRRSFVTRHPESNSEFPIIVAAPDGTLFRYSDKGVSLFSGRVTIENVPPEPVVTYRNVYRDCGSLPYRTKEDAINAAIRSDSVKYCVLRIETVDSVNTKVEVVHTY